MEVGIVGLPLSGKTTLFSTLSGQSAEPRPTAVAKLKFTGAW
jgi:ribosome-binding ATPase YchF (GTP1/OBG family)